MEGVVETGSETAGLQALTDERPDVVAGLLAWLDVASLLRLGMTCRGLWGFVQREARLWESALRRETGLEEALRLPACFAAKTKLEHALRLLGEVQSEARTLRATWARLQAAPPAATALDGLRQWIQKTKEPLHDSANNPFLKAAKKGRPIGRGATSEQDLENKVRKVSTVFFADSLSSRTLRDCWRRTRADTRWPR
jgi:hypothetical protein